MSPARPVRKDRFRLIDTCDAKAHVEAPHLDRGPDAQARARHGRLLRGAAAARLARPRGAHGLLAATSSDAIVLGGAPAAARRPAHDVWPLRRQGSRHLRPRPQQVARARRRPPRLAGAMLRSGVRRAVPRGVSGQSAAAAGQPRVVSTMGPTREALLSEEIIHALGKTVLHRQPVDRGARHSATPTNWL